MMLSEAGHERGQSAAAVSARDVSMRAAAIKRRRASLLASYARRSGAGLAVMRFGEAI